MTAFQNPNVKFVNINTAEFDAYKVGAIPVVADARVALEQLSAALGAYKVSAAYAAEIAELRAKWDAEVDRLFHLSKQGSDSCGQAGAERSDWRDVGGGGRARRAGVGGGQPSRRPAQAVADAHAERLPHGVRLLVHGIRDSGGDGREDGRPEPRGVCISRRRNLFDGAHGNCDIGAGRREDHHRAGGQWRVRQHRQPEPVAGAGRIWNAVSRAQ